MTETPLDPISGQLTGLWHPLSVLGGGGMGVVYRAEHVRTGQVVALKTVRSNSPGLLDAIRREIHVLRRTRHPGVVRIVDAGVQKGVPWYAMELLSGMTLHTWMALGRDAESTLAPTATQPAPGPAAMPGPGTAPSGGGVPLASRPTALGILRRLCDALVYLHGEGVVHRDLKPANVFLRDDLSPVLVDFGLVSRFGGAGGREGLGAGHGTDVGTVAYMAPEQIRGELVDARTDLYALGCILYEVLAGHPPFVGAPPQVVWQHLETEPLPPSSFAPEVPPALDALVARLLAKDPARRLGYADDVAAELEALGAVSIGTAAGPAPRPYLYRPSLVARGEALARVERLLPERGGPGRVVVIAGASGVGKTRLALEVGQRAAGRRVRVVRGECQPLRSLHAGRSEVAEPPLYPLRPLLQAIADHCRVAGLAEREAILGERGALLAQYEPTLASLVGPGPLPPALSRPESAQERLDRWLAITVRAFAARRPLLLVVDDVQWADELTLHFLQAVAAGHAPLEGVLVLATVRSDTPSPPPPLVGEPGVVTVGLERLAAADVARMVGDILAIPEPPDELVDPITTRSGGNPFYVGEYLHLALARGVLVRAHGAWSLRSARGLAALPAELPDLLAARYAGLDEAAREVVDTVAVASATVDGDLLAAVTGLAHEALLEATGRLLARTLLHEIEPGRFRFAHDRVRDAVYEGLDPAERSARHRRVAEALEARKSDDWAALAHHWSIAGDDTRAYEWLGRAALRAARAGAPREACSLFDAAFELEARLDLRDHLPGDERIALDIAHAQALHALGRFDDSLDAAGRALRALGIHVPQTRLGWASRTLWDVLWLGLGGVRRLTPEVRANSLLVTSAATLVQRSLLVLNNPIGLVGAGALALRFAVRSAPDAPVAHSYTALATLFGLVGLDGLYDRLLARGRAAALRSGVDLQMVTLAETFVSGCRGRWERAETSAEQGIEASRHAGDEYALAQTELALGVARLMRGDLDGVESIDRRAFERARENEYAVEEQHAAFGLASVALDRGRPVEALRLLEEVQARHEQDADDMARITGRVLEAIALADLERVAEARARADEALAALRGIRPRNPGYIVPYLRLPWAYLALHVAGDRSATAVTRSPLAGAREALHPLYLFSRFEPPGRAGRLRLHAQLAALQGRSRRVRPLLLRSLAEARRRAQPLAEALAEWELGRLASTPPEQRAHHDRARRVCRRLGVPVPPPGVLP